MPMAKTARVYADEVMAADLGRNDRIKYHTKKGSSYAIDEMYIRYDFTTKSGYAQRKEDWAKEGAGLEWHYPVSSGPYSKKNCRVLSQYAYITKKSFTNSGKYPGGKAVAYTDMTPLHVSRQYFERAPEIPPPAIENAKRYEELRENAYNIMPWYNVADRFVLLQAATTSPNLYTDTHYTLMAMLEIGGLDSSNPPYIDIAYEDITPYVKQARPTGFVDKTKPITLSWEFTYSNTFHSDFEGRKPDTSYTAHIIGKIRQKKAVVRWKQAGSSIVHEQTLTTEKSFTIPQGQVTADSFQWQVVVTSDDDITDAAPKWYTATTDNDSLSTAKAISPQKLTIDGSVPQEFVWEHYNESGTQCTRSELQISADDGRTWQPLADIRNQNTRATVPADTLPNGVMLWHVRTYNINGVAGQWSEPVTFNCRGASGAPILESVGGSPLPLIRWKGQGQIMAEIQIDGESEFVYGQKQEFQWRKVLEDGPHTAQVRIQNQYALWSKWGEISFETENFPQSGLIITGNPVKNGVVLSWNKIFDGAEIRRDGDVIKIVSGQVQTYTDWESGGTHRYSIRGFTDAGYYTDSISIELAPEVKGFVLGSPGNWIALEGRYNSLPEHTSNTRRIVEYQYYAGRRDPVAYPSDNWENTHQFSFSLRKAELDKLQKIQALSGSYVMYKDSRGDFASGILGTISSLNNGRYTDVQFDITKSDERSSL